MVRQRFLIGMRVVYGQSAGWDQTRVLHLDWMPLAQPPGEGACAVPIPPSPRDQSADEGTLIEVLTADDDDDTLSNGTPHCEIILSAFAAQNILPLFQINCGGDGLSGSGLKCYADFDSSTGAGVLDMFDYVAFQLAFVEGSDCACDFAGGSASVRDIFDFLAFQVEFVSAFEK